jgi:hypothetical protein
MTTKGEKFFLPHAVIASLEKSQYPDEVDFYSYDVSCMLKAYLLRRDPALSLTVNNKLVLGHFHSKTHKCRRINVAWSHDGAGLDDGEQGEWWNSSMVSHASSMRYMRKERMNELLEYLMLENTKKSNSRMGLTLLLRAQHSHKFLGKYHAAFKKSINEIET